MCNEGYKFMFDHACCLIIENDKVLFIGNRKENVYKIKIDACMRIESYLVASIYDNFLWHIRLDYIRMNILSKLVKTEVVKGLHIAFNKEKLCNA
jgi:hypothetical protein